MNVLRKLLFIITALFAFNATASVNEAKLFIQDISDTVLSTVTDKKMNENQKEEKLNRLFESSVDINWIAKFVMGRYWNDAGEEQRAEYLDTYKKFLITSYVPSFRDYNNQRVILSGVADDGDGEYTVQTEIETPGEANIRVDYKVKKEDGKYRIFDIVAEGISLITTQRSEFGSVLSRNSVDVLIKKLDDKVKGL